MILKKARSFVNNRYLRSSFWAFLAIGILNVGNFLFHFLMPRFLPLDSYGILESSIAFLYILYVPVLTVGLVVVKFVSEYKARNDYNSISSLYYFLREKTLLYGIILVLVLSGSSPLIVKFFHFSNNLVVILLVINFFVGLLAVLGRSILQGLSSFFMFTISNSLEALGKVFLGLLFVGLGFQAEGALFAVAVAVFVGYLFSHHSIRRIHFQDRKKIDTKRVIKFFIPVFISTLSLTSLYTSDVLLVRHYFSGTESGYYAALSLLGKIVFFAVSPITLVLFPLVSEHFTKGSGYLHFLYISIFFTLLGAGIITTLYFLIPEIVVEILFTRKYLVISNLAVDMGIFSSLYSLCTLLTNYFLSIQRIHVIFFTIFGSAAQILLISFFHSSLQQVIQISIFSASCTLFLLVLYFIYHLKKLSHKACYSTH